MAVAGSRDVERGGYNFVTFPCLLPLKCCVGVSVCVNKLSIYHIHLYLRTCAHVFVYLLCKPVHVSAAI